MQVSSTDSKAIGTPVSNGERSFMQSTSTEPTSFKNLVKTPTVSSIVAKDITVNTNASAPKQVDNALEQVNDAFVKKNQNLLATIEKDKETGINVLRVTDKETKELVRQFPAEAVIAMAAIIRQSLDPKGQLIHVNA